MAVTVVLKNGGRLNRQSILFLLENDPQYRELVADYILRFVEVDQDH